MALDCSDKKLTRYFDALFVVGRMGDSAHELANLQKVMSAEDYADLLIFDEQHHELVELISRDEDEYVSPKELKKIADYEKKADTSNIPSRYKIKMYECVLIGVDKFDCGNTHSLLLLGKILENTPPKNRDDLQRLQKVSLAYRFGAGALYEQLNRKIELKLKRKEPNEVENAVSQFNEISSELKQYHPTDEKIALLKKQLELVDKCAFKRMKKFQTKSMIYYDLSNEYAAKKDIGNHDDCLKESVYYKKLVQNIKDHIK